MTHGGAREGAGRKPRPYPDRRIVIRATEQEMQEIKALDPRERTLALISAERGTKMKQVATIEVVVSTESIFGELDPVAEGYDEAASLARYIEELENHLIVEYPDAEITIKAGNYGAENVIVLDEDGHPLNIQNENVSAIVDRVWQNQPWEIEDPDHDDRLTAKERRDIVREAGVARIEILRERSSEHGAGYPDYLLRGYDDSDIEWRGLYRYGGSAIDIDWQCEDTDGWPDDLA